MGETETKYFTLYIVQCRTGTKYQCNLYKCNHSEVAFGLGDDHDALQEDCDAVEKMQFVPEVNERKIEEKTDEQKQERKQKLQAPCL